MRFLIIFIFLITNSKANENLNIKNLVLIKEPIKYDSLTFLDHENQQVNLDAYLGNLIIINFWATWCAPCKEEMPSLDQLKNNPNLKNLKIFPINVGSDDVKKSQKFFDDLEIRNLNPYFVPSMALAKKFALRGIPTSIFINKEGKEFARVVGSTDFIDKNFLKWLISFN